jgi:hypothetical protein
MTRWLTEGQQHFETSTLTDPLPCRRDDDMATNTLTDSTHWLSEGQQHLETRTLTDSLTRRVTAS